MPGNASGGNTSSPFPVFVDSVHGHSFTVLPVQDAGAFFAFGDRPHVFSWQASWYAVGCYVDTEPCTNFDHRAMEYLVKTDAQYPDFLLIFLLMTLFFSYLFGN